MALSAKEIEELQGQLKQKKARVQEIYDKLAEAGVVALPDDFLDCVAGGLTPTIRPLPPSPTPPTTHPMGYSCNDNSNKGTPIPFPF